MSEENGATQPLDLLLRLLDLERLELNLFRGQNRDIGSGRVFGGQVLAQALVAAGRTVEGRQAHSLHGYFMLPGDVHTPIVYQVDRIRDGRSFTTRRVLAIQEGREIFSMLCSFHVEEQGIEHGAALPDVPPPEALPRELDLVRAMADRIPEPAARGVHAGPAHRLSPRGAGGPVRAGGAAAGEARVVPRGRDHARRADPAPGRAGVRVGLRAAGDGAAAARAVVPDARRPGRQPGPRRVVPPRAFAWTTGSSTAPTPPPPPARGALPAAPSSPATGRWWPPPRRRACCGWSRRRPRTGAIDGIPRPGTARPERRAPPSPALPHKQRGGGRTAGKPSQRDRLLPSPAQRRRGRGRGPRRAPVRSCSNRPDPAAPVCHAFHPFTLSPFHHPVARSRLTRYNLLLPRKRGSLVFILLRAHRRGASCPKDR